MRYTNLYRAEPLIAERDSGDTLSFCIVLSGSMSEYEVLRESEQKPTDVDEEGQPSSAPAEQVPPADRDELLTQLVALHRNELKSMRNKQRDEQLKLSELALHRARFPDYRKLQVRKALALTTVVGFAEKLKRRMRHTRAEKAAAARKVQATQRARKERALPIDLRLDAAGKVRRNDKMANLLQAAWLRHEGCRKYERRRLRQERVERYSSWSVSLAVGGDALVRVRCVPPDQKMTSLLVSLQTFNEQQERAATRLQAVQRGRVARQQLDKKKRAAIKLQSFARGRKIRLEFLLKRESASDIERISRGFIARRRLEEQHIACSHVQARVRVRAACKLSKKKRDDRARELVARRLVNSKPLTFLRTGALDENRRSSGETALLFGESHTRSVIADQPTEVAVVDRDVYSQLVEESVQELLAARANFLGTLPVFIDEVKGGDDPAALSAFSTALVSGEIKHGEHVPLTGPQIVLVESGELSLSRLRPPKKGPLLVLGKGCFYGGTALSRRLEATGEIGLVADSGPCRILWVDVSLIAARLGQSCVAAIVAQEGESLSKVTLQKSISRRPKSASVWKPSVARVQQSVAWTRASSEATAALAFKPPPRSPIDRMSATAEYRTLGMRFKPKGLLAPGVAHATRQGMRATSIFEMVEEQELAPLKKRPLPRSGLPASLVKPPSSLPELPPAPYNWPPAKSLSRPATAGRLATSSSWSQLQDLKKPPRTPAERSHSIALLVRPGSALVGSDRGTGSVLIEDAHGRMRQVTRM